MHNFFCMFLQETFVVFDTILWDMATTGNKNNNWHIQNGTGTIATFDDGTLITNTGTGSMAYIANLPSTSPSGWDSEWEAPLIVEFDVVDSTDLSKARFQIAPTSGTSYNQPFNSLSSKIGSHHKIEFTNDGYTVTVDDNAPVTFNHENSGVASIRFFINEGGDVKYKNFKIYSA